MTPPDLSPGSTVTVLPGDPRSPVVLHVPHAATTIPRRVRDRILLDEAALAVELSHMTDAGTGEIATAAHGSASPVPWVFRNELSRLVVDPERFPDEREEMLAAGMGAVYTRTSHGQPLRHPDAGQEADLLQTYFHPYATALADLVDARLAATGSAVIVDLHSYPAAALPYEIHRDRRRPAACLGVDETHTPQWLVDLAARELAVLGEPVVNEPFAGTYVPQRHYQQDRRVLSIMLELRRDELSAPEVLRQAAAAVASLVTALTA